MTLSLWGCTDQSETSADLETTHTNDSEANIKFYKTDCDEIEINKKFVVQYHSEMLRVFIVNCPVYCSPGTSGKIIDTLEFNSEVKVVERIKNENQEWFRISNSQESRFVKKEALTLEPYNNLGYLIGYNQDRNDEIELKSIKDDNSSKAIANYTFSENNSFSKIKNISYNGLDKTGLIIKYSTTHNTDPTVHYYEFVNFSQETKSFTKIVSYSSTYIDECESDEEIFYFPLKFDNGKILLVKDADHENIFNYQTAELNTIEYPSESVIPIEQLIVKITRKTECIVDKDGSRIIDPITNSPKTKITVGKVVYYKWDGQNLTAQ